MQAYARSELAPAAPGFYDRQRRRRRSRASAGEFAAPVGEAPTQSAAMALAALLLDELDDDALRALARRLAPHLSELEGPNQQAHIAYTVRSLAGELDVSPKAVRCAIRRGELRAVKRGSRWIIASDAVAEWATASEPRHARTRGCPASTLKTAGPSLRSVLCGGGAR